MRNPRILVFDSGLGGLTVQSEIFRLRPHADYVYCADDAAFPYGPLSEDAVVARVETVMADLIRALSPDIAVIACNTASTLVLPHLRARWPALPFVGTVPAIKPAALSSKSRVISVLATPGTVARDYTQALIRDHAAHCDVTLVGSVQLATLAEAAMHGALPDDDAIVRELAPCFVDVEGRRTDRIVLACTHYPLLLPQFQRLAGAQVGWHAEFIDPAPAIARRTDSVLAERGFDPALIHGAPHREFILTSGRAAAPAVADVMARYGLGLQRDTHSSPVA